MLTSLTYTHAQNANACSPEAVARHASEGDDHGDGRDHGGPRLREGGDAPGDGEDAGPDHVLDEVEDRPAYGYSAGAAAGLHLAPGLFFFLYHVTAVCTTFHFRCDMSAAVSHTFARARANSGQNGQVQGGN